MGLTVCAQCSASTYYPRSGATTPDACFNCAAGTYSSSAATAYMSCPTNHYGTSGATACKATDSSTEAPWFYGNTSHGAGWIAVMCISGVILFASIALQVQVLLNCGQGKDDKANAVKITGKFTTILVWMLYEFVILCLQFNFLLTLPHAQYRAHEVTYANDAKDFMWLSPTR